MFPNGCFLEISMILPCFSACFNHIPFVSLDFSMRSGDFGDVQYVSNQFFIDFAFALVWERGVDLPAWPEGVIPRRGLVPPPVPIPCAFGHPWPEPLRIAHPPKNQP